MQTGRCASCNEWTDRRDALPQKADGDENGMVFAWHAYQGVMLVRWNEFAQNRFNIYWMRMPERMPMIQATERLPTKGDADELSCVLAKDMHGEIKVIGYHQFAWNSTLAHWMRLPAPPSDYRKRRNMQ